MLKVKKCAVFVSNIVNWSVLNTSRILDLKTFLNFFQSFVVFYLIGMSLAASIIRPPAGPLGSLVGQESRGNFE